MWATLLALSTYPQAVLPNFSAVTVEATELSPIDFLTKTFFPGTTFQSGSRRVLSGWTRCGISMTCDRVVFVAEFLSIGALY